MNVGDRVAFLTSDYCADTGEIIAIRDCALILETKEGGLFRRRASEVAPGLSWDGRESPIDFASRVVDAIRARRAST